MLGLLAFFGWTLDHHHLTAFLFDVSLNPVTSICIILLSISIFFYRETKDQRARRLFLNITSAVALTICAIRLLDFLIDWNSGIDQMLFAKKVAQHQSHMALATTLGLTFITLSMLTLSRGAKCNQWYSQIFATSSLILSFFAFVSYIFKNFDLLETAIYSFMSFNTAIALTLLSLSLLFLSSTEGFMATVTSPFLGGLIARRLLPATLLLPVIISLIWQTFANAGLYPASTIAPLSAVSEAVLLTFIVFWMSSRINVSDKSRKEIEAKEKQLNKQLSDSMSELNSFSYSLTHDLKAPLRGITYFCWSALNDCKEPLEKEVRENIERAHQSAQKMDQLISGLMALYKVNRSTLKKTSVNLSDIVESFLQEKISLNPDRRTNLKIKSDVLVEGDPRLLENMMSNLLENSWKFSEKKEITEIEFGVELDKGKTIYFIQDRGAGFDMTYSHQLFKSFKRLHNENEFPGTGIGLATVQRIIHKHQGEIWAHSEPDKGARFSFTLNDD